MREAVSLRSGGEEQRKSWGKSMLFCEKEITLVADGHLEDGVPEP